MVHWEAVFLKCQWHSLTLQAQCGDRGDSREQSRFRPQWAGTGSVAQILLPRRELAQEEKRAEGLTVRGVCTLMTQPHEDVDASYCLSTLQPDLEHLNPKIYPSSCDCIVPLFGDFCVVPFYSVFISNRSC